MINTHLAKSIEMVDKESQYDENVKIVCKTHSQLPCPSIEGTEKHIFFDKII